MGRLLKTIPAYVGQRIWLRYLVAIFSVALAIAGRLIFLRSLGTSFPLITFYPAAIVTALYGGLPAGLLATALSALAADYFFLTPQLLSFRIDGGANLLGLTIFIINCTVISYIAEVMHKASTRAGKAEAEARLAAEREKAEAAIQARFRMLLATSIDKVSVDDVLRISLDEIEAETGSEIGFYHFLEKDQETLSLQNWSTNTLNKICTAEGKGSHYPVSKAGVWVDCVRERRPIIHNDYASLPHRKGMPQGHAPVIRELVVPIMRGDRIVAIIGVGNKKTPYSDPDVEIVSLLGDFSWEIVERNRAEEQIRRAAAFDEAALKSLGEGLYTIDEKGLVTSMNPMAEELFGWTFSELRGKKMHDMTHHHYRDGRPFPSSECAGFQVLKHGVPLKNHEDVFIRKDGTFFDVIYSIAPLQDAGGKINGLVVVFSDITERKRAEEAINEINSELKNALDEKEVLIKELYHRTKNNMNVISGLLHLQMNKIDNPETKQLFKEAQGRIQAMALVHEMLYKTKELSKLDLKDYLERLARLILKSDKTKDIKLILEMDSVPISLYVAVPCGLILNELMSNSIKHAFPGKSSGEIILQLKAKKDKIELSYADNGVGLSEEHRVEDSSSLGLRLVDGLVKKQLLGSLEIINGQGIKVNISFDKAGIVN